MCYYNGLEILQQDDLALMRNKTCVEHIPEPAY